MSSKKTLWLWFFSIILTFFISFFIASNINKNPLGKKEIIRKKFNYQYINPILECNSDINNNLLLTPTKNSVESIIKTKISQKKITFGSIYFRDLNNGPWFGINEEEYFSPASLIKIPVLIAYLKKAESDPSLLQKKILSDTTQDGGTEIQNIKPSSAIESQKEYSVDELLTRMIIYSDNDAYNTLSENLNSQELLKVYQDLDVDISKAFTNPNGNILTVTNYASFFRILFNASYLNHEMSEKALKLLTQVDFKQSLVAGVPSNITVAHKFGERKYLDSGEIQFHDCGIIYLPNKPYLLCIMTKTQNNIDQAIETIKEISNSVYQSMIYQ